MRWTRKKIDPHFTCRGTFLKNDYDFSQFYFTRSLGVTNIYTHVSLRVIVSELNRTQTDRHDGTISVCCLLRNPKNTYKFIDTQIEVNVYFSVIPAVVAHDNKGDSKMTSHL